MATLLPDAQIRGEQLHGYRIFLFSHDHPHPAHLHMGKGRWFSDWDLNALQCMDEDGFSASGIALQRKILIEFKDRIWSNWHDHWKAQSGKGK